MRRFILALVVGVIFLSVPCSIPLRGECWSARIIPPTGLRPDNISMSVAGDSDRILVGAVSNNSSCSTCEERAAFVYRIVNESWVLEAELFPPDPTPHKQFGVAVALGIDVAIIGASRDSEKAPLAGAVYVFRREGSTWSFDQKLTPNDPTNSTYFGTSLALGTDRLLVGASGTSGGVYEFQRTLSGWAQVAKIRPPSFGGVGPIDLYLNTFAVGVPADNIISGCVWCSYGSVFIYRFDGTRWQLEQRLFAEAASLYDKFGSSLSLGKENILVGLGGDQRATFNFQGSLAGWKQVQKFAEAENVYFANSRVAQNGSHAFVATGRSGVFQLPMDKYNLVGTAPVAMLLGGELISDIALTDSRAIVATKTAEIYVLDLPNTQCESDCNTDTVEDSIAFYNGVAEDCNSNGVLDECEYDCDGNGIPDSCEADCNGNDVVDACDIQSGTSTDCSGDGRPDECDDHDCNSNGVPDDCDIISGTSSDDDVDSIPDDCESWIQCEVAPGLFDYGSHRANAQAEIMAMLASGELRAPDDLYERIDGDMRRMETTFPILESVDRWSEGTQWMYVILDPSKPWTGFDELNAYYQAVSIVPSQYTAYARNITFCDSLNIHALQEQYAALPEVTYTQGGVYSPCDWTWDCIRLETHGEVFIYGYSNGGGDCPSGCTCEQSWRIATTSSGEIAMLSYIPGPAWCGVPNDGDFDGDGIIDYDDPCPAGEVGEEDPDADGVFDPCDACSDTIPGAVVDSRGCTPPLGGDVDRDGDIGLDDFKRLSVSMMGPFNPYGCDECIADGDSDVDLRDIAVLQRCSRGEGTSFVHPCK